MNQVIFEKSKNQRGASAQFPNSAALMQRCLVNSSFSAEWLRVEPPCLPELSELEVVRHYTALSKKNFAIDTNFYPLGSCTMKYNPRGVHKMAMGASILNRHPLASLAHSQGFLECMYELQNDLKAITGMVDVSLTPMAGAHGEWAGVAMIKAYHNHKKDFARKVIIVPDAAHGTNPATAVMCGYEVREIPTAKDGDIDLDALQKALGPDVAGIMLTNPSTLGVFERKIKTVAKMVHEAGGLLYYDGANLNAILGKVRPGDMGFDVMHMNVHKTFATPHGGGGPGAGPIAVSERLAPFLPIPGVIKVQDSKEQKPYYRFSTKSDRPLSIGRMSAFMGNAGILLRAYFYIKLLGKEGLKEVGEMATLNANYLFHQLTKIGYEAAYPTRRASHEFIITCAKLAKENGVIAMDVAKRLLDFGMHAPTTYFPLLIPECLLIEPTETESVETLDKFIAAMKDILHEAKTNPEKLKGAPWTQPVRRLDDVKAARQLDLTYTMSLQKRGEDDSNKENGGHNNAATHNKAQDNALV